MPWRAMDRRCKRLLVWELSKSEVVPGVAFVLLHDRELHAVDWQQFVQRQAEGLGLAGVVGLAPTLLGEDGWILRAILAREVSEP